MPPAVVPATAAARQGTNVCYAFNAGQCQDGACPRNFLHRCSICNATHAACEVTPCKDKIDASGRPIKFSRKGVGKGGK